MILVEETGMRRRIIQEATRLFTHNGYNAVSMREIAAACGITKAALYYHFKDKQDLFGAILNEYLERMNRLIDECSASSATTRDRLSAFIREVFRQPAEQRAIIRLASQDMTNLSAEFQVQFNQRYHTLFIGKLAEILEAGVQSGELKPANGRQAAWVLLGMMYPFFYPHENQSLEASQIVEWISTIFFEGITRHD